MPPIKQLKAWALIVLKKQVRKAELTIRVATVTEMADLNAQYRGKKGATNVLSFPLDHIPKQRLFGDIIICAEVVNQEAIEQEKSLDAHWAHMVIHGTLHLLGYDHISDEEAAIMEPLEINFLQTLGFSNPYSLEEG